MAIAFSVSHEASFNVITSTIKHSKEFISNGLVCKSSLKRPVTLVIIEKLLVNKSHMQLKTKKENEEGHLLSFPLIQQPYVLPSQIFIFLLSYINSDINNLPARFTFLDNTLQSLKPALTLTYLPPDNPCFI